MGTGTTGSLFGQQNKPQTGFNFGASTGALGTTGFGAVTSTAGSLFGTKPTGFGTGTAFGGGAGTGLFGTTGTLGTATGLATGTLGTGAFGSLGTQQTTVLGISTLGRYKISFIPVHFCNCGVQVVSLLQNQRVVFKPCFCHCVFHLPGNGMSSVQGFCSWEILHLKTVLMIKLTDNILERLVSCS